MCEELDNELKEGINHGRMLVIHLLRMGAGRAVMPINYNENDYVVQVTRKDLYTTFEEQQSELTKTRELLAGAYRKESQVLHGIDDHLPDCGVHKAPAQCPEPCSCGPKIVPQEEPRPAA